MMNEDVRICHIGLQSQSQLGLEKKKLKYETGMYRARAKTSGATKTKDKNICVDDSRRSKRNDEDDREWGE